MIRVFIPSDTDVVIAVWEKASALAHPFLEVDFVEKVKKDIREIYLIKSKTWVYLDNEEVVGFISMLGNEIGAIFLDPIYHGKGYGKAMMDFVAQKHETLEVEVFKANEIGRRFYDKYGFQFMKEYIHEPTNQAVLRLKFS